LQIFLSVNSKRREHKSSASAKKSHTVNKKRVREGKTKPSEGRKPEAERTMDGLAACFIFPSLILARSKR
jgi:hypothetical protein